MPTETTGRTPQDLAAELASMRAVDDWPSVWSGPPQGGVPGRRAMAPNHLMKDSQ
ncbi:hypothetical protein [Streptomyces sp. NPDC012508]|uniref:hypothetical protein n=1 Tax=Streptomyces sp. NPDC012508 TaxID=3364837 RepID=UPI003674C42B